MGTKITINSTKAGDSSVNYGVHKGGVSKLDDRKDFALTDHLTIDLFSNSRGSNDASYAYSESTVTKLEKLIQTYSNVIDNNGTIVVNSSYRPSDTGTHGKGCAVDIKFPHVDGGWVDTRYIAIAAEKVGFTGIAPLHAAGNVYNVIHLDTRADYVDAGGTYGNTKWHGYETPPPSGNWFISHTIYTTFQKFYGISDADFKEYMRVGQAAPSPSPSPSPTPEVGIPIEILSKPKVNSLSINKITSTSAEVSTKISCAGFKSASYTLSTSTKDETVTLSNIGPGVVTFSLTDLIPNSNYAIQMSVENTAGITTTKEVKFKTLQSYPDPVPNILISTDVADESASFTVTVEEPADWGYWERAGNEIGYRVFAISNFKLVSNFDSGVTDTLSIIPKTYKINHGENFQVGISSWVKDNDGTKIFARPGEDYPTCSNSICLIPKTEIPNNSYICLDGNIYRVQAFIKDTDKAKFMPVKIFKL